MSKEKLHKRALTYAHRVNDDTSNIYTDVEYTMAGEIIAQEAEITRLRGALKQLDRDLESMGMLPEGGKIAMVRAMRVDVDKALTAKGAEDGQANEVVADIRDNTTDSAGDKIHPTPLSEPLKPLKLFKSLDRGKVWDQNGYNAERIEAWSAEIVAAIAEIARVQNNLVEACVHVDSWNQVRQEQQEQIDSLWERTDIYVDLQEKQREQINALEGKVERQTQAGKAAWMMEQAKKIDAINKRLDEWEAKNDG